MNSNVVSEASLLSLVSKRNALFDELEYFLQIPLDAQGKGISRNLVCRVSICCFIPPLFIFRINL